MIELDKEKVTQSVGDDRDGNSSKVVILLDPLTKVSVESLSYDALSRKALVITDIREVNEALRGCMLLVFEPAFGLIVTKEIADYLRTALDVQIIGIYQLEESKYLMGDSVALIRCNYSQIDWNLVYGIIHSDKAILEPYQKYIQKSDPLKAIRARVPKDVAEYIDRLYSSFILLAEQEKLVAEDNVKLKEIVKAQDAVGKRTTAGIKELKALLDMTTERVRSYETILSESYDKVFTGFYPYKPTILYIRSISHVSGIDIFLNILFTVLTTQYKVSCKVLKLLDESNARGIRYIPNSYVPVKNTYDTAVVLNNEFLMKLGQYNLLFDLLLLNKSGLDYLIVHDMRCSMHDALDSSLITLKINEVSADYAALGEYENMLSDLGKQVTFPWSYRECKGFLGSGISKLVNHPTVTKVINLLL